MSMAAATLQADLKQISDDSLASAMSPDVYNERVSLAHYNFNLTISAQTPTTGQIAAPENAVIS